MWPSYLMARVTEGMHNLIMVLKENTVPKQDQVTEFCKFCSLIENQTKLSGSIAYSVSCPL
jgi:hypothetical protein